MKALSIFVCTIFFFLSSAQASEFGEGKFTNRGNLHWLMNSEGAVFIRTNNVGGEPYASFLAKECAQGRSIKIVTGLSTFVAATVEKNCKVFRSGHPLASPAQDTMIISGNTLIVNGDIYSVGGPEVIQEYEFMRYVSVNSF